MKASSICYEFIKRNEGFSLHAYLDSGGVPTIGWGTTHYNDGRPVKMGDVCTEAEAQTYLEHEVGMDETAVNESVTVPLTQAEFDALVDFAYNVGTGWITGKGHTQASFIRALNQKNYAAVPPGLMLFTRDIHGRSIPGLVTRRKWEAQMWLQGEKDHAPIVASVVQNDPGAMPQIVTQSPVNPQPLMEESSMTTSTSTPASVAKAATAGVNVSNTSIVTTLFGTVLSSLVAVASPLLAAFAGSTTMHYIVGTLFALAGVGSAVSQGIGLITTNATASQNTITQLSALAQQAGIALNGGTPPTGVTPIALPAT